MSKIEAEIVKKPKEDTLVKRIARTLVACAALYVFITLLFTLGDLLQMVGQNKDSRNMEYGKARYEQVISEGVPEFYYVYSAEEMAENAELKEVKLFYFPAPSGDTEKFAVVLPGGGYFECNTEKVAFPTAAKLNELGYSAFVLQYRYGTAAKNGAPYAPVQDLGTALQYIFRHAGNTAGKFFNVDTENYAIYGFSAGGNLAGLFGSKELGYARYGLPKPGSLTVVYPWININEDIPLTGNPWQEAVQGVSQLIGNYFLLGSLSPTEYQKLAVCVQNHVTPDYPKTYIVHGDNDFVVPYETNSMVMVKALQQNNVQNVLQIAPGANHGFGLGIGTSAEGWVEKSVEFWLS